MNKNVEPLEAPIQIVGQALNKPTILKGLSQGEGLAYMQLAFPLSELDFYKLKSSSSITANLSIALFGGWVGYGIGLGPKVASLLEGNNNSLEPGEIKTLIGVGILTILIYLMGFAWPDERKKTMSKIANHFDGNRPSSHIVGQKDDAISDR